jgi:hypothetical protein
MLSPRDVFRRFADREDGAPLEIPVRSHSKTWLQFRSPVATEARAVPRVSRRNTCLRPLTVGILRGVKPPSVDRMSRIK